MSDLVSVVMATYKHADYLETAIRSVLAQTHNNLELIVVSVAGDHPTRHILKPYRDRIVWIEAEPANYIRHRNLGIQKAKGEWITFMDSDDVALPNKLSQELKVAREKDALLVYSPLLEGDENLNPVATLRVPRFSYEALLLRCFISDFCLVSKRVYEEFGLLRENLGIYAMFDKWLRVAEKYPDKIALSPYPETIYRQTPKQMSKTAYTLEEKRKVKSRLIRESLERFGAPMPDLDQLLQDLSEFTGKDVETLKSLGKKGKELMRKEWREANPETPEEIIKFYKNSKSQIYDLAGWHTLFNYWIIYASRLIRYVKKGDKVLDMGAGIGTVAIYLARRGCDVTAVDVDRESLSFAEWRAKKHGLPIKFITTNGEVPSNLEEYEKILMIEVLEHLTDPVGYTEKLVSHLKTNGLLIYSVTWGETGDLPWHLYPRNPRFKGKTYQQWLRDWSLKPLLRLVGDHAGGVWRKEKS